MTLLRKTTSFLKTANSSLTKELQVGTEINLNIVTGLGNILAASSKDMDINSELENAHIDKNKVRRLDKMNMTMPLLSLFFVINHVSYLFDGFFFFIFTG